MAGTQPKATTQPAATGGTGNPQPPAKDTPVVDFKDGKTLRDGTKTADAKYTEYKADVTEGQTIQTPDIEIPAKSAANFDEEGMDPYEVYEAEREKAAQAAGRP